jgi:hypothetical protein
LHRKGWGNGLDPKRTAVAEDDCEVGGQINTIKKCVEIMLEASKIIVIDVKA